MIRTKDDLKYYLEQDRIANHKEPITTFRRRIVNWIFPDNNYEYLRCLRKLEYCINSNCWGGLLKFYYYKKLSRIRRKTGIELPPNVAGPGLHIPHGKIVVNSVAKIGRECKILSDVTIGWQGRYDLKGAPQIGNRVFIGSGAKIIGNISIADDVVIGANSVLIKSVTEAGITVAGIPAVKVSDKGSYHYLNKN